MTEIATFPLQIQEPVSSRVTELSRTEAEHLASDVAVMASVRGIEAALADLQQPLSQRWLYGGQDYILIPLKDRTVVDLGCGIDDSFRKFLLPKKIGMYIGVDYFLDTTHGFYDLPIGKVGHIRPEEESASESFLVQGEMLDVVSRLPDESCSFIMNGIDDFIVDSSSDYGRELIKQIDRATTVGGYVMGVTKDYGILSEFGARTDYDTFVHASVDNVVRYERHRKLA